MRLRAVRIAVVFLVVAACVAGCGKKGDPVRESLNLMVKEAHNRDADALLSLVTSDFQAADGSGRAEAEAVLRRYFAAYEILDVTLEDVQIEHGENAARARFRADLSGQPRKIGGLDGLLPSSASYDFDLRLVLEGGKWRVAWASWNPAGGP